MNVTVSIAMAGVGPAATFAVVVIVLALSGLMAGAGTMTTDEVVFGEPNDLVLLGARTLEGMNVKLDIIGKRLVPAGPVLAAVAA